MGGRSRSGSRGRRKEEEEEKGVGRGIHRKAGGRRMGLSEQKQCTSWTLRVTARTDAA